MSTGHPRLQSMDHKDQEDGYGFALQFQYGQRHMPCVPFRTEEVIPKRSLWFVLNQLQFKIWMCSMAALLMSVCAVESNWVIEAARCFTPLYSFGFIGKRRLVSLLFVFSSFALVIIPFLPIMPHDGIRECVEAFRTLF